MWCWRSFSEASERNICNAVLPVLCNPACKTRRRVVRRSRNGDRRVAYTERGSFRNDGHKRRDRGSKRKHRKFTISLAGATNRRGIMEASSSFLASFEKAYLE